MRSLFRGVAVVALLVLASLSVRAQGRWPSEGAPGPLKPHPVQFPPYETRVLPNGLQVVAVLQHEQPVVSMRLIVRAGSARDPRDKAGLARLLASLLDQGTDTMSAFEMNDAVDFIGGEMSAGAGTDLSFLRMLVMKDSFSVGLRLLADMARRPAFAQAEIDRQRQQMLSTLQVRSDDPEYIANSVFDRFVYGSHPYGFPNDGTSATVSSITRADLVDFHVKYFVPNNAILAVVGDVTADEAFEDAVSAFGDWQKRDVATAPVVNPPSPSKRVIVVNKPDAVQTEIRIGHIGVKRNSSDYMALNLALRILGGEGANRLHQVLRTERSLTYGAQAAMNTLRDAGDFEAETSTRTDATGQVVSLIIDEFWRIQRERVDEAELAHAKAYLTGSFPLTIETPDAIATQVLNVLFFGLPVQELQSFRDRVNAITVDDIERVARYYLHPDRLSIVLVGNAAGFTPQLRKAGIRSFETIDVGDLDLMARDVRAGGAGAARKADRINYSPQQGVIAQEGAAARALVDKVIDAKGGLDVLRGVRNITAVTHALTDTPDGRVDAKTTTYLAYPNRVRVETTLSVGTIVQVYDGARAWVKDPRGVHDVPTEMARQLDSSFSRDVIALLLAARDGRVRARLLPDVKADDGKTYHLLECSSTTLEPTMLYIDPATNLVAKQTYVADGPAPPGARPEDRPIVEESFSDYQPVNGIQIAFTASVRQGGRTILERHVTDIRINEPLDARLFTRPTP
jgi:zinc protease